MDAGPRIPQQQSSSTPARGGASSLPPPGSVVMASVEENLGEGMYALRWNGNRISVTSRAILTPGQSLILKSEISPEGKPTLVVQGPALPEPGALIGRPLYRPPDPASSRADQGGTADKNGSAGQTGTASGGEMAAGVVKAGGVVQPQPVASLLGLVLEPLDDFALGSRVLLEQAKKEQEIWKAHFEQTDGGDASPEEDAEGGAGEETAGAEKEARPRDVRYFRPMSSEREFRLVDGGAADAGRPVSPEAAVREVRTAEAVAPPAESRPVSDPASGVSAKPESGPAQSADQSSAQAGSAEGGIKPEIFLKEALTQMVKAAELPLASPAADIQALGAGQKVPEAIADKAAAILLRASGLTPDESTMQAARALVENNVPVDRQTVQAMLALAAAVPEEDRDAMLKAAARLAARDIPLAAPLAGGLSDVMARKAGVYELMDKAAAALAEQPITLEAKPLADAARRLLELLQVDLDGNDAASALERYVSTFGREALGKALALVEKAAQAVLENHPLLPRIDQAMTALLTLLEQDMAAGEAPVRPGIQPLPAPVVSAIAPPQSPAAVPGEGEPPRPVPVPQPSETISAATPSPVPEKTENAPPESPEQPVQPPPRSPINAYINAPRRFPGLSALDLPPMPRVATLPAEGQAIPHPLPEALPSAPEGANQPAQAPVSAVPQPGIAASVVEAPVPQPAPLPSVEQAEPPRAPAPQRPPANAEGQSRPVPSGPPSAPAHELTVEQAKLLDGKMALDEASGSVLRKLDSLFQTPGLNRPEVELLKPSGFLEKFLASGGGSGENAGRSADSLVKDLLSDDPEKAEKALRDLPAKERAVLREAAGRLARMEREILRSEPQLSRLSDAAGSLRELGRQLLAVKAENLAGQERNPPVMLAEVPFKLADSGGDGRMQMFYRRGKSGRDGWTSRVILDLNTTILGPVLGDMRFFGSDMVLNMFVEKADTAAFLDRASDELAENLLSKGFRLKSRFMVLPPPPVLPEIRAERPDSSREPTPEPLTSSATRRLDTKA